MWVSLWKNYRSCRVSSITPASSAPDRLTPFPQFVEDEGEVVFYKDALGRAARRVVYESPASDSGVEVL
jgi:omega-6 fatty acid desaturase (delta-12 desaturase)